MNNERKKDQPRVKAESRRAMLIDNTVARSRAFVKWDSDDGVPGLIIPELPTSGVSNPEPIQRATIQIRVLPDGTPQLRSPGELWARFVDSVRVIRLSSPSTSVDIATTGQVKDVVLDADGSATVLERTGEVFGVRGLRPDGTPVWGITDVPATYRSRLLTDLQGRVFLTGDGFLMRVDDGSGHPVTHWQLAEEAVMHPDGRVGSMRYDFTRDAPDWVLFDPDTGAESSIEGNSDTWGILEGAVGMDASGRVYGHRAGVLGRMAPDGHLDWRVELGGIAVSAWHGVTVLSLEEDGNGTLLQDGGRVPVDRSPECEGAMLAGHRHDGGYVLYKWADDGDGELLHLNAYGQLTGVEPAGSDVPLTTDVTQHASLSSVTPDGEVLVAVTSRAGVHVVGLKAGRGDGS